MRRHCIEVFNHQCEDLAKVGIPVTMVQRSPTLVSGRDFEMSAVAARGWPEGIPAEISDFKVWSVPRGFMRNVMRTEEFLQQYFKPQAELHDKLRKGGVMLDLEKPQVMHWWERMGGQ